MSTVLFIIYVIGSLISVLGIFIYNIYLLIKYQQEKKGKQ